MSASIVSFALVLVILVIHVMHACPLSTSLCKQYGHSCLGGHGKRSENEHNRLLKYLLRELYDQPKQEQHVPSKDVPQSRNYWEIPIGKIANTWESDSDDSLNTNFLTEVELQ